MAPPRTAKDETRICVGCGAKFVVRGKTAKRFCTYECFRSAAKAGKVTVGRPRTSTPDIKTCPICNVVFEAPPWEEQIYCSRVCWGMSKRGVPITPVVEPTANTCPQCHGTFFTGGGGRPHRGQVCCSKPCSRAYFWGVTPARTMSEPERAWLAGLVDGEGSIFPAGKTKTSVTLVLSNTHRPLLERVQAVTGTGIIRMQRGAVGNHAACFTWRCHGDVARNLIRQMRSWLIVKAAKADAVTEAPRK